MKPYRIKPSVWVPGRFVIFYNYQPVPKLATFQKFSSIFEAMTYVCLLELAK